MVLQGFKIQSIELSETFIVHAGLYKVLNDVIKKIVIESFID